MARSKIRDNKHYIWCWCFACEKYGFWLWRTGGRKSKIKK